MRDLKDKSLDDLKIICRENGLADFKAREIFAFIHHKLGIDLKRITSLKKEEREKLGKDFFISTINPIKTLKSRSTEKVAFELEDKQKIEAVMMRHEEGRLTLCISCQTGCPIGCLFCATGTLGPGRNLSVSEILSQVYYFAKNDKVSNIVFMGMGEPFLNYANVLSAARIFNHKLGLNIAARSIVFSTIGIISGIKKLAQETEQFRLAWSLVSPLEDQRPTLTAFKKMPKIHQIVAALKEYQSLTRRRITVEYTVLSGISDDGASIQDLIHIAQQLNCHVNLIPYNDSPGLPFASGNIERIRTALEKADINVTVRRSFGQKISAACGQLAGGTHS
jgi:23S rRNA (adenine2503-C2)-methyltransferase